MNIPYTFVFFGLAGSGKGTQVEELKKYLLKNDNREVIYISPGFEYRKLISDPNDYTGSFVRDSLNRGELQPFFLTSWTFTNKLVNEIGPDKYIVCDGFPRDIRQSQIFEEAMNFYQIKEINIIYIEVGIKEAKSRIFARNREDDTEEGIKQRNKEYNDNVLPAMEYFRDKENYKIHKINGEQSPIDVHRDIIKALEI